jgi:glycosyltransferase involved in cell wall biosynthesis
LSHIVFTVTNNLTYDQRMIRICTSLAGQGYIVTLVGVKNKNATPLTTQPYTQKRLYCFFSKGFGFYAEYNIRLFFYLLFLKANVFCCIDLDTMLPIYFAGKLRSKKLVYDAHEYFSQQKEIITRPKVYKIWYWIERTFVPKFKLGYTVSYSIAKAFKELYNVDYEVVMNATVLNKKRHDLIEDAEVAETKAFSGVWGTFILYQGAVNEARGLEFLIPAMQHVDAQLHIYGDGNYLAQTQQLINQNNLANKVFLKGKVLPAELEQITLQATIGINLVENKGLNQYYSLANKFFDYIHAQVPQLTMNFPEYKRINDYAEVAILLDDLKVETIANALNELLNSNQKYTLLQTNCIKAREQFNWEVEEKKLVEFYKKVLPQSNAELFSLR